MMGLPLAFAAPAVLSALILLPVIWWLLRVTPPRPRHETFPPTRILLEIAKKEETPSKSPWWLTLLRLVLAALVILALAGPVLRPVAEEAPGSGPLLIVVENGWASAPRFDAIMDAGRRTIAIADRTSRPVSLIATAEGPNQRLEPVAASEALKRLEALVPRPYAADRQALLPTLGTLVSETRFGGVTWLSDGLGSPDAETFARFLSERIDAPVLVYSDRSNLAGLKPPTATAEALTVPVIRRDSGAAGAGLLRAVDLKGRSIGEATYQFAPGTLEASASFTFPAELRNEIVRVEITGETSAGAVQLLDDRFRRRSIGLISGASADTAQPLLSPLYYITRAVSPFADIREPSDANVAKAVPELIASGVSVIAMADIGTLPKDIEEQVAKWVADGGTLVRFAGKRLAGTSDDKLIPVKLRLGDRQLGGSLTWETPQPMGSIAPESPFAGMAVPSDVIVQRQVLADPSGDLTGKAWAALADGTPLVTASTTGKGSIVLFHVTADPSWSNLPLSGTFVEMLRRIIAFSHAPKSADGSPAGARSVLPPYRLLDGYGRFTPPGDRAQPVTPEAAEQPANAEHPPGLYGAEDGFRAVNLLRTDTILPPLNTDLLNKGSVSAYPTENPQELAPYLLGAALVLLVLDGLAVLWLAGLFRRSRRAVTAALVLGLAGLALLAQPVPSRADAVSDAFAMKAVQATHLAYVVTGNRAIDEASRSGLASLSKVLADRTALEPGAPIGVDIARDELAFFPLLYWPVDANAPLPSAATLARIDAYMKQGGSIIFDTRDQLDRPSGAGFVGTPAAEKLRDMLATLDIPPLEPVPTDHVLTKAFYLLTDFPGRYAGGQLWVEASPKEDGSSNAEPRPARGGDGVTTILITSNDLAGAWAADERGQFLYPTVPTDPLQREMSFRVGVNIVMYTLTGNYKADQVHVPALLERLGQ